MKPLAGRLKDIALTIIWPETLPALFAPGPKSGPLGHIGSQAPYAVLFESVREAARRGESTGLTLPWPRATGQGFWLRYFEGRSFDALTAQQAWRNLVPLRLIPARLSGLEASRIRAELFAYPSGIVIAVTLRLTGEWPDIAQAVDAVMEARWRAEVMMQDSGGSLKSTTRDIGPELLERARRQQLGAEVEAGPRPEPFTVVTVIQGEGVDPQAAPVEGDAAHRVLNALAGLDPAWKQTNLGALGARLLPGRSAPPGHVLFARKRGRAVWFPNHFTGTSGSIGALTCYHRNLVLTSVTIEALGGLAASTASALRDGQAMLDLPIHQQELSRRATVLLSQFYLGKNTYATMSAKAQLQDSGVLEEVRELRAAFGLPALA